MTRAHRSQAGGFVPRGLTSARLRSRTRACRRPAGAPGRRSPRPTSHAFHLAEITRDRAAPHAPGEVGTDLAHRDRRRRNCSRPGRPSRPSPSGQRRRPGAGSPDPSGEPHLVRVGDAAHAPASTWTGSGSVIRAAMSARRASTCSDLRPGRTRYKKLPSRDVSGRSAMNARSPCSAARAAPARSRAARASSSWAMPDWIRSAWGPGPCVPPLRDERTEGPELLVVQHRRGLGMALGILQVGFELLDAQGARVGLAGPDRSGQGLRVSPLGALTRPLQLLHLGPGVGDRDVGRAEALEGVSQVGQVLPAGQQVGRREPEDSAPPKAPVVRGGRRCDVSRRASPGSCPAATNSR